MNFSGLNYISSLTSGKVFSIKVSEIDLSPILVFKRKRSLGFSKV